MQTCKHGVVGISIKNGKSIFQKSSHTKLLFFIDIYANVSSIEVVVGVVNYPLRGELACQYQRIAVDFIAEHGKRAVCRAKKGKIVDEIMKLTRYAVGILFRLSDENSLSQCSTINLIAELRCSSSTIVAKRLKIFLMKNAGKMFLMSYFLV